MKHCQFLWTIYELKLTPVTPSLANGQVAYDDEGIFARVIPWTKTTIQCLLAEILLNQPHWHQQNPAEYARWVLPKLKINRPTQSGTVSGQH
jgi:hypothetical protein